MVRNIFYFFYNPFLTATKKMILETHFSQNFQVQKYAYIFFWYNVHQNLNSKNVGCLTAVKVS